MTQKPLFFCPRWGSEQLPWAEFLQNVQHAGYDGIEYAIPSGTTTKELDEVWNLAQQQNLHIIAQHYDTGEANFQQHTELYSAWLEKIKPYPVLKINSQTGKDHFNFEQNQLLHVIAHTFARQNNINIVHETHRGKFSFACHTTAEYLRHDPKLRLTLDVSHWLCVAESWLEDQQQHLDLAIQRTDHIHARIGHTQGPQIPDPRLPEWQYALDRHFHWWQKAASHKSNDHQPLTITTEFGPIPYMANIPGTTQPIRSQWHINLWMLQHLKRLFS